MDHPYESGPRASSLLLLCALLLYIGGVVVDPLVHLAAGRTADAAVAIDTCPANAETLPAPADVEHECETCKLSRLAALPASARVAITDALVPTTASPDQGVHSRAPPTLASLQPRAPPHI
jgi:hypothetical protein